MPLVRILIGGMIVDGEVLQEGDTFNMPEEAFRTPEEQMERRGEVRYELVEAGASDTVASADPNNVTVSPSLTTDQQQAQETNLEEATEEALRERLEQVQAELERRRKGTAPDMSAAMPDVNPADVLTPVAEKPKRRRPANSNAAAEEAKKARK